MPLDNVNQVIEKTATDLSNLVEESLKPAQLPAIYKKTPLVPFPEKPEEDVSMQPLIMAKKRLKECLSIIPAKYLWGVIGNEKNMDCCRDIDNLSLEIRKTQDIPMQEPDLYKITCDCGRRHVRMLCEPGHYGDPEKQPEFELNPCVPKEFKVMAQDRRKENDRRSS